MDGHLEHEVVSEFETGATSCFSEIPIGQTLGIGKIKQSAVMEVVSSLG